MAHMPVHGRHAKALLIFHPAFTVPQLAQAEKFRTVIVTQGIEKSNQRRDGQTIAQPPPDAFPGKHRLTANGPGQIQGNDQQHRGHRIEEQAIPGHERRPAGRHPALHRQACQQGMNSKIGQPGSNQPQQWRIHQSMACISLRMRRT